MIFLPDGKIYGKNPRFLGLAIRQWVWRAKLVRGLLGSFRSALFDHKHLQRNCTTYRQANRSRENNGTEYLQWSRQLGKINENARLSANLTAWKTNIEGNATWISLTPSTRNISLSSGVSTMHYGNVILVWSRQILKILWLRSHKINVSNLILNHHFTD